MEKKKKENNGSSEDETDDGNSSDTDRDQDSDISFMNDTNEEIDTAAIEQEDWTDYMKRSRDEAMERRPRRRWEDEVTDFFRSERTEDVINNVERNNREWIKTANDQKKWMKMENKFAVAAAASRGS